VIGPAAHSPAYCIMRGTRFHDGLRSHGSPGPNFVFLPLRGLTAILKPCSAVSSKLPRSEQTRRLQNQIYRLCCQFEATPFYLTSPRPSRYPRSRSRLAPFSATPEGARTLIESHPFDFQVLGLQFDLDLVLRFMLRSCTASAREPSLSTLSHVSESRGSVVLAPLPDPESPHLCFCWELPAILTSGPDPKSHGRRYLRNIDCIIYSWFALQSLLR
jgi:hypothetical protein